MDAMSNLRRAEELQPCRGVVGHSFRVRVEIIHVLDLQLDLSFLPTLLPDVPQEATDVVHLALWGKHLGVMARASHRNRSHQARTDLLEEAEQSLASRIRGIDQVHDLDDYADTRRPDASECASRATGKPV